MIFQPIRLIAILCCALLIPVAPGQQSESPLPAKPADLADVQPDTPIERTSVSFVQAPVTVTDRDGNIVNGLQPNDFKLYDNGKEQDIRVDVAFQPISLVIAIECSNRMDAVLKQIQKIGILIEPLVIGEQGEAAVLAFDHRIREMQGFTNDSAKIQAAVKKINAGSTSSRMIDAVDKAVYMLRSRPQSRRRIILLISENRDQASEGKVKEALMDAQLSNVTVYSINVSRMVTSLTTKPIPPRPPQQPATATTLPGGQPSTPTTNEHLTMAGERVEFVPALVEIYKDAKGIFVPNPIEVFTRDTGGAQFVFYKQRGLEDAVSRISEEIHSQYIISYSPNNKSEGGFHEIQVKVDRPDLKVRTRPGYYLASIMK